MKKTMQIIILLLLAAIFIFPILATLFLSFSSSDHLGKGSVLSLNINGYKELFLNCFIFYPMFWNSVLYSLIIVIMEVLIVIPCAFGLSFAKFKGKNALFIFFIVLMMMPLQVTILPNYIGLRDLNLINTRMGIILPMIFSPFGAVVMHQYMKNIDTSAIDALRLETNSVIRIIYTAVIPQIKICIFAVILFLCAESWNMVEQPTLFLKDKMLMPLSVFINSAKDFNNILLFPAAIISMLPIVLLYLFYHENLEKGITFGDLT